MLPLLLALAAVQAAPATRADWRFVTLSGPAGDRDSFYADAVSLRRDGHIVRINEAREGQIPTDRGVRGARFLVEYDCRGRTSRVLTFTLLRTGGREDTSRYSEPTHRAIAPTSAASVMLAFACEGRGGGVRVGSDLQGDAARRFRSESTR